MRTDHVYAHRRTKTSDVDKVIVQLNAVNRITATIVREDGRCLNLYMSLDDAKALADSLCNPEIIASCKPAAKAGELYTPHGTASVEYLGSGHYRIAGGAAYIRRHPSGKYWTIDGESGRYATQYEAVTTVMLNL